MDIKYKRSKRHTLELLEHYNYEIETLEKMCSLIQTIDSRSPSFYEILSNINFLISFNEKMKSYIEKDLKSSIEK